MEDLDNMDKQYRNLVKNRNEQINFNSMCNDSSLEAVADSGTTGQYIIPTTPCTNKQTATQPIPIKMPNGEIIKSSHITLLPQHNLPDKARQAHIFPGLLVIITVLLYLMKKGSQSMTNRQDRLSCRATETQIPPYT